MGMNVTTSNQLIILEDGENSIFHLLSFLPPSYSILSNLYDNFYRDTDLFSDEICSLRDELIRLKKDYCDYLINSKKINTSDESALKYIRLSICDKDSICVKISKFIIFCELAIEMQTRLSFCGD
jgi:hypothetical protein